jgi:hypothetical protein
MRQVLLIASTLLIGIPIGWIAASAQNSPTKGKEPRFPQLTLEQLTDQQRPLGEKIMKISSVGLGGPYNPMLRSPVYAQRMYDLLDYLRWHTSVPTNTFTLRWATRFAMSNDPRTGLARLIEEMSRQLSPQPLASNKSSITAAGNPSESMLPEDLRSWRDNSCRSRNGWSKPDVVGGGGQERVWGRLIST